MYNAYSSMQALYEEEAAPSYKLHCFRWLSYLVRPRCMGSGSQCCERRGLQIQPLNATAVADVEIERDPLALMHRSPAEEFEKQLLPTAMRMMQPGSKNGKGLDVAVQDDAGLSFSS